MDRIWRRVGQAVAQRGRVVGVLVLVVTLVLAGGLTRLRFETSQASLISPSSERLQGRTSATRPSFGGEPMIVLYTGPVDELVSPENLARLRALEDELRATGDFVAVLGPAMALDFAADQLDIAPAMLGRRLRARAGGRS